MISYSQFIVITCSIKIHLIARSIVEINYFWQCNTARGLVTRNSQYFHLLFESSGTEKFSIFLGTVWALGIEFISMPEPYPFHSWVSFVLSNLMWKVTVAIKPCRFDAHNRCDNKPLNRGCKIYELKEVEERAPSVLLSCLCSGLPPSLVGWFPTNATSGCSRSRLEIRGIQTDTACPPLPYVFVNVCMFGSARL